MTPLETILREEIAREGPIPFRRFMEAALYHPELGYYRRTRDPFGKSGDFFTAEQIQPVFGILIGARVRSLYREMGEPRDFTVVELGAGRAEMAEAFSGFRYVPVDVGRGEVPESFTGVVFSNEFFDALPVDAVVRRRGVWRVLYVGWSGARFDWVEGEPVDPETADYLRRYIRLEDDGALIEVNLEALRWIERISARLQRGYVLTIDYGYTDRESVRFPGGTLMGYRRHRADDDVLVDPGERDITAHVCFTALEQHGARHGLERERFERLAQMLLDAGQPDSFAAALAARDEREERARRLQLKTLLFGMGETFRVLLQRR